MTTATRRRAPVEDADLRRAVVASLDRWPTAGLAVVIVRDGQPDRFLGHGIADIASRAPMTAETVFRIGSVTKTMTALAVMQLCEQGLVDLDVPAQGYLRSFRLVPAGADLPPVTVRHLLTHTAGIGYWRRWSDLLRPGVGSGNVARAVRPMADYYRDGLPVEVAPGTKWMYSNHGFATLGQIVEDLTGEAIDRYLRDHVFSPLGMDRTDLTDTERVGAGRATGYVLRARGLVPATEREAATPAASSVRSTPQDLARYATALLHGGANEHGTVLEPGTLALMFRPHHQPDPRVPGYGLGFELGEEDGHRTISHGGILSGFLTQLTLAPDDGVGVVVLANTGALDGRGAPETLAVTLLRRLLGLPDQPIRTDLPARPEAWAELCGWYGMAPGPLTNTFNRLTFGAGVEVVVRRGHLMLLPLSPIPALRRGFRLHPDDDTDPYVFRVDLTEPWGKPTYRVIFRPEVAGDAVTMRMEGLGLSLRRRPSVLHPRRWATGSLLVVAGTAASRLTVRARAGRS
jgi:CubicO group peptidase (beta-lactamase class C family)